VKSTVLLIDAIHVTRAFGIGLMTIIFPLLAASYGLHAVTIGIVIGASVFFGAIYTFVLTRSASRWGPVPFLFISSVMFLASSVMYLQDPSRMGLLLVAILGFIPPTGGIFASALEEGALSHVPGAQRTRTFAVYGMLGTAAAALGSLAAGFPHSAGLSFHAGFEILLTAYGVMSLVSVLLSAVLLVSSRRQQTRLRNIPESRPTRGRLSASHKIVYRLAALFVVDASGSGVVTTPLLVYWLHVHFQMSTTHLALLFFGTDLLAAVSFPLAERVSRHLGLLNTAVFTHIPSSLLLIAVPFSSNGTVAALLLLFRGLLVEMDVPTRQSYIAAVVQPTERVEAAGVTSIGKQIGRAIGPAGGGWMLGAFGALGPFVLGGALKIAYDLTLWYSFRHIKPVSSDHMPQTLEE
jgi:predicted MFS family arabinose efflux permease